jgi:DNA (cytosine-5)-methyltransferase 1
MKKEQKTLSVVELFAGVGGFRLGLENSRRSNYKVIWSNQWEPSTIKQHASDIYIKRFGAEGHSCEDISRVMTKHIPDHDLLVGGFPCQDYSVARTLKHAQGLTGKKGVLWWEIYRILKEKGKKAPSYIMLENVDRLLKSPSTQRGRDFAVMLASLSDLGYVAEWRIINSADYGMPQRRRRVYLLGYKKGTEPHKEVSLDTHLWLEKESPFAKGFSIERPVIREFIIDGDLSEITTTFNKQAFSSPFESGGIIIDRRVFTFKPTPKFKGRVTTLGDMVIKDESKIPEEYFISDDELNIWKKLKGAKKEMRKSKDGFEYKYAEGPIAFPDSLDRPSRTIVTGEGGTSPSRFKHVVQTDSGRYRRLMPEELEALNMFPKGHTREAPPTKRAFFMGNALVVGVIKKLAEELSKKI